MTTIRTSLDQLIIDTEAAMARLEAKPSKHGGPVRQEIARLSIRLEALEEARDSLRGEAAFFHGGRWVPVAP
jgi:hypothetical protein